MDSFSLTVTLRAASHVHPVTARKHPKRVQKFQPRSAIPVICRSMPLLNKLLNSIPIRTTTIWLALIVPNATAVQTGQFVVALSGLVGLALGRNRIAFPPSSAAWVPPGCRHEGFLGEGAVSLYCHINPEWAAMLPTEPYRLLLSPMVIEMLKHFSTLPRRFPMHSHEARLAGVLFEELAAAPKLPISFVLFPDHPALKRIAESIIQSPQLDRPVASWAQETAMSERTLARLVLKETGLSFGAWRLKIAMLTATQKLLAGERAEEVAAYLGYAAPSAFQVRFGAFSALHRVLSGMRNCL